MPTTELDILRGIQAAIADLDLGHPHAMEKMLALCSEGEWQATKALDEYHQRNPVQDGWACIVGEPTFTDEIETASPELDEAFDEFERKHPELVATLDRQLLAEARNIEASHVEACFAPALKIVSPKG